MGGSSLTIRNSFGNIELENIAGTLDAETSNGKVSVHDARGTVTLRTSFGAIEASNIPKGIRAITGNGAITLTDIGADAYAKTSFGSISAERVNGNLTAEDSNGSVTARNVKGDATVTTSFSGVTLESIGGRITVDNQNGAIFVTTTHPSGGCRDISLKTSFLLDSCGNSGRRRLQPQRTHFLRAHHFRLAGNRNRQHWRGFSEWHDRLRRVPLAAHGFERQHRNR